MAGKTIKGDSQRLRLLECVTTAKKHSTQKGVCQQNRFLRQTSGGVSLCNNFLWVLGSKRSDKPLLFLQCHTHSVHYLHARKVLYSPDRLYRIKMKVQSFQNLIFVFKSKLQPQQGNLCIEVFLRLKF